MKEIVWICAIACVATMLSGCSGFWGKKALTPRSYPSMFGTNRALVVLLPGFGGKGTHFEKQGFLEGIRERGFDANMKTLDIKPTLYLKSRIVEILKTEVITHAKAQGYELIFLVGISMGGHGALLYVTEYPEDVDGVLLLSPFISGPLVTKAIEDAGGLDKWEDCPFIAWDYACNLWKSLKDYVSNPENRANIYLGYGTDDIFVDECRVLADILPPEHVFTVPGRHDWATWKKLWIMALEYFKVTKPYQIRHYETQ